MNLRSPHIPTMFGALLASLLTTAAASAQEVRVQVGGPGYAQQPDWVRFRGGIDLEGGVLAVPSVINLGTLGLRAQMGVQINNNWGVYFQPSFDGLFGPLGGVSVGAGVMVDYTFNRLPISVGIGPEAMAFVALGASNCDAQGNCTSGSAAAGGSWGARLHFAYYPVMVRYAGSPRRRALAIGFDLRILDGGFASATNTATGSQTGAAATGVGLSPMVSIGYTAF
jgi:hypothetical protein